MPALTGVLETALYVGDLPRSRRFYQDVFAFQPMVSDARFCAFSVEGRQELLLFQKGATLEPFPTTGGAIPPHGGAGELHLAFSIPAAELDAWEKRLLESGVPIESRVAWPEGGQSLYFRDPDRHLLELVTPGCWPIY
jgi:catechol 2,3-dioxygenase-like lactoylglutathione lyase family enzyme